MCARYTLRTSPSPSTPNPSFRKRSVELARATVALSETIEADGVVVHAGAGGATTEHDRAVEAAAASLRAIANGAERGRVFSIYMVGTFIALGLGQLLVGRAEIETDAPFNIIVALFAMALVLVSTTRAEPPQVAAAADLPYGRLSRAAPVAVAGAALNGIIASAFYALVPAWMQDAGIPRETIALFMLVAVLGGTRIDRHAADGVAHGSRRRGAMLMRVFGAGMIVMMRHA